MKKKHYVCQGAICRCLYGNAPDKLVVKTQNYHYINDKYGSSKLTVTTADVGATFEKNSFGSCSKKNNSPCTVAVTQWNGYYEKVTIVSKGEGKALLEDSTADCPVGGSGCISIVFHGQQAELSKSNFRKVDPQLCDLMNPAGDMENIQQESEEIYDAS